ncbi:hypothetical protein E0H47_31645 [Rhizobium leguminosarum bv. viciae]|uniref:hypothetical protein n=1 Tax=Rhizobium leguminosarum TaxID=384 RepID=UPI001038CCD1|nr:hypothetical protein [Rhizobium leguminosarum]TBZ30958.1 hypothetical protein E0H47_31645 [Rhizobium leguminosarum bv. viciae]
MRVRVIASSLICCLISFPAVAFDKPLIIDGKDSVKELIDKFQGAMDSLIKSAGGETRVTMFRGFQLGRLLIGDLKSTYADSLEKTFDELDEQQQKTFEDAREILSAAEDTLHGDIQDVNKTMSDLVTTLNNSFLVSDSPIVTRIEPAFLVPSIVSNEVQITVRGFKLRSPNGAPSPEIIVGGKSYRAQGATDTSLDFVVPRSDFPQPIEEMASVTAELKVYQDTTPWILSWITTRSRPVSYPILMSALPDKLGSFVVTSKVPKVGEERRTFTSKTLEIDAPSDGGTAEIHDCFVPSPGFKFDINTAEYKWAKKLGWYREQADNRYNHGWLKWHEDVKTTEQICLQVGARTGAPVEAAKSAGYFVVDEAKPTSTTEPSNSAEQNLEWKEDTHFPSLNSEIVSVKLFGISFERGATEASMLPFLEIDPDPRSGQVFLRPQRVWEQKWD